MSQNDFNIANQTFPATRADVNAALQALASQSAGATQPATRYAYQIWADTANNVIKRRNAANTAWIEVGPIDGVYPANTIRGRSTTAGLAQDLTPAQARSVLQVAFASQAQAEGGTDTVTYMNPLRAAQAIKHEFDEALVGSVAYFATTVIPSGWLRANGATISRTTYNALFARISTTFGAGNGSTTFQIPNLRGEFIRGWTDNRSGVDQGRVFGSSQSDAMQGHNHNIERTGTQRSWWESVGDSGAGRTDDLGGLSPLPAVPNSRTRTLNDIASALSATTLETQGSNGAPRVATETRSRNVALLACIKF